MGLKNKSSPCSVNSSGEEQEDHEQDNRLPKNFLVHRVKSDFNFGEQHDNEVLRYGCPMLNTGKSNLQELENRLD